MNPVVIIISNPNTWNGKTDGEFNEEDRRVSVGKGGDHQRGNGNSVVICVSDLIGMEDIASRPDTFITSYEKVKGYRTWVDDEWVITPPELPDKARYDAVYTPNHPNELPAIPGGYDMSHLTF